MKTQCLEGGWQTHLGPELEKPYMRQLSAFLKEQKALKKHIYPQSQEIFSAFRHTPIEAVKVVILGQDPYHGVNQAHGLCFSVRPEVAIPPSLLNIYKELKADLNVDPPKHGCLIPWAQQGVLLINSVLTVEKSQAASHQGKGWEQFTDKVIEILNAQSRPIVFVLWGAYAQKKGAVIDPNRHCVIKSVHPSPLSAHRGFLGSRPFSKINAFLTKTNQTPIDWQLPEAVNADLKRQLVSNI